MKTGKPDLDQRRRNEDATGVFFDLMKMQKNSKGCALVRRHLTGSHCVLLKAAREQWRKRTLTGWVEEARTAFQASVWNTETWAPAIEKRLDVIALLTKKKAAPEAYIDEIQQFANQVEHAWSYSIVDACRERFADVSACKDRRSAASALEPSFLSVLPHAALKNAFRALGTDPDVGWLHPGLLLAGDTIAYVTRSKKQLVPDRYCASYVMFAFANRGGVVAELVMERLAHGCGVLIPSAKASGYLSMNASREPFSLGLQHAWYAVREQYAAGWDCDYRWSLNLRRAFYDLRSQLPQLTTIPLDGRSGEVAFACAMMAVHPDNPDSANDNALDLRSAVTAKFAEPLSSRLAIAGVDDIDLKTVFPSLLRMHMWTCVHATNQDDGCMPSNDPDIELKPAVDLNGAYEGLSKWRRITLAVKKGIYDRATRLREKLCGAEVEQWEREGRNYVVSPLTQVLAEHVVARDTQDNDPASGRKRKLSPDELEQLRKGTWRDPHAPSGSDMAPRVAIFGNSGIGKSIQLLVSEQAIAGDNDDRVPIRVGKNEDGSVSLHEFEWRQQPQDVLDNLFQRTVAEFVPTEYEAMSTEWLNRQAKHGELVLLFDALDERRRNDRDFSGLGTFLRSRNIRGCFSVLAGRHSSRFSQDVVFECLRSEEWSMLEMLGFGPDEQRQFLGSKLSPMLIPHKPELNVLSDDDERKRHQWKDLLETPLLIKMMKELALSGDLKNVANRFDLYTRAVDNLVSKGVSNVKTDASSRRGLIKTIRDTLGPISLKMICDSNFTSALTGAAYQGALEKYETTIENLKKLDLLTQHHVMDGVEEEGVAFRHRSFVEYFAGIRLAELWCETAKDQTIDVKEELRLIHEPGDELSESSDNEQANNILSEWEWPLRFALASTEGLTQRNSLAMYLLSLNNPWIVYESIDQDKISFSPAVAWLTRWLVHRDLSFARDYSDALMMEEGAFIATMPEEVPELVTQIQASSILLSVRDSSCLDPLLDLRAIIDSKSRWQSADDFVPSPDGVGVQLFAAESLSQRRREVLERFCSSFVPLPNGVFDLTEYHSLASLKQSGWTPNDKGRVLTTIQDVSLSAFFVTNEEFEALFPSHRRRRDGYSNLYDQPCIYVSWYMCRTFGELLTAIMGNDRIYRLPTEWEWEWACRWGGKNRDKYWFGNQPDSELSWGMGTARRATRSRLDSAEAHSDRGKWPNPEDPMELRLLDMTGNVWCWCGNRYDSGRRRVMRGGSWINLPSAVYLEASYRNWYWPEFRGGGVGFRLASV
ncbi:MAG: formylglycine-generating enzyme family protein, partial [Planctomycetales bacterium]|nr:formylglycine-generating enzyme family protein [Planctomycetales bacterium]